MKKRKANVPLQPPSAVKLLTRIDVHRVLGSTKFPVVPKLPEGPFLN